MTTETFFLPREVSRIHCTTPSEIYNLYRSLFIRNKSHPAFVPIRSMQFMAVLDHHEIVFVDSQSYAVSNEYGGRIILIAWQYNSHSLQRNSLNEAVDTDVVFYDQKNKTLQQRLVSEFHLAMKQLDARYRDRLPKAGKVNIVQTG